VSAAADLIWERARETLFVTREQFMAGLAEWQVEAVERDGTMIGAVMRKGPEFHFCTTGALARIDRQVIRDVLAPQMERYGYVLTRTPKIDARQHRFNRVMGFVAVGEDRYNVHYRLDRDRSAATRSAPCPLP
jgi:hypothetical protein